MCDGVANNCDADVVETVVPTDHATLQEAIDARAENTLICLEAGTYEENITITGNAHIGSFDGPETTTLTGFDNAAVLSVEMEDGEEVKLDGLSVTTTATRWDYAILVTGVR